MIKNRVKNIKKSQKICVCFCFINVSKTTLLLSLSLLMNLIRLKQDLRGSQREQQPILIFLLSYFIAFFLALRDPIPSLSFFSLLREVCVFFLSVSRAWFLVSFGFQNVTNLYSHVIIFSIYLAQQSWILFTSVLYMSTRYCAI